LVRGVLPLMDRFGNSQCREQVAQRVAGRRYELAVLEHFWTAAHLGAVRRHAGRVVLDLHNVESALHEGCTRSESGATGLLHRAFARVAAREEREWLPQFDLVLTASEEDRRRVRGATPEARVAVYPNAIPLPFPAEVEEEHVVAFSGNLEYHPNQSAVRYFARDVWPALRQQDSRLRWRLIGKNEWAVRRWMSGDERIEATGAVEDALRELARARVVVVPLLAGSGTRVKILEAWAASRAVVSTRAGAEGLPAVDGENLLLADRPGEMVEAVVKLLGDRELRRRLGWRGRQLVEEQFAWPSAWEKLEQSLAALGCLPAPAKIV
jgi:glycosyltransferase involved in cell wall biosynthesis